MSFLDDIVDFAGGVVDFLGGGSLAGNLAKTALLSYTLSSVQDNTKKENAVAPTAQATNNPAMNPIPDAGVRLQVMPDADHKIPIIYGNTQLSGIVTDAELANGNRTLWVCFTICERTGVKLSDGLQSSISFKDIYINDQRVQFDANGYTLLYTQDRDGNQDNSFAGLIDVYCYNNGSNAGVYPFGSSGAGIPSAHTLMPSWTSEYSMDQLVFALVKITYSVDRGLQKIPVVRFNLINTMFQAGDCIYDYMTNTRYGAGIPAGDIYSA
jgi:hypothetical protein